jgi:hypothetical protein
VDKGLVFPTPAPSHQEREWPSALSIVWRSPCLIVWLPKCRMRRRSSSGRAFYADILLVSDPPGPGDHDLSLAGAPAILGAMLESDFGEAGVLGGRTGLARERSGR